MRFRAEHQFGGTVASVATLLTDPVFARALTLPDLSRPEVLDHRDDADGALLQLRYEFEGSLDPIARRLIGSGRLTWIQTLTVDRSRDTGTLRFEAERGPQLLHGTATFSLVAGGATTTRVLDGELRVAIPGLGRMAERTIVPGLLRRLDIEAQALDEQLRDSGPG